jgi:hypothetical protein
LLPPEKQEYLEWEAQYRALAETLPKAPRDPNDGPFGPEELQGPPVTVPHRAAGAGAIIDNGLAPFPGFVYGIENQWYERTNDELIKVYAGFLREDSDQGMVLMSVTGAEKSVDDPRNGLHLTPMKAGALRITDAEGELLIMMSESGREFRFDVAQGWFVYPLLEPTPSPTQEPAAPLTGESSLPSLTRVAMDMDVNNTPANTATSLGSVETCNTVGVGEALKLDVTVEGIPPVVDGSGGLLALSFNLLYDEAKVKVVGADARMMVAATSGSSVLVIGDSLPDTDGDLSVSALDTGTAVGESGDGVLARITLEGVQVGIVTLTLAGVGVTDVANETYPIDEVLTAQVAVGATCP